MKFVKSTGQLHKKSVPFYALIIKGLRESGISKKIDIELGDKRDIWGHFGTVPFTSLNINNLRVGDIRGHFEGWRKRCLTGHTLKTPFL